MVLVSAKVVSVAEGQVRVFDSRVLDDFRTALVVFAEESEQALASVESDAGRAVEWVERDRKPHWKAELRRREEALTRAKTKLLTKEHSNPRGEAGPSLVDERKAVERARRAVDEAREKLQACQRHSRQLERAVQSFKGRASAMRSVLSVDVPDAVGGLQHMARSLEEYARLMSEQGKRARMGDGSKGGG